MGIKEALKDIGYKIRDGICRDESILFYTTLGPSVALGMIGGCYGSEYAYEVTKNATGAILGAIGGAGAGVALPWVCAELWCKYKKWKRAEEK